MKTRHYRMSGFVLLCLIIVYASCSNVQHYEKKMVEKDRTIGEMQHLLDMRTASISEGRSLLDRTKRQYEWLRMLNADTKWDKVVVRRFVGDAEARTITDPVFLANIGALLHLKSVGETDFPSGYQSDVGTYVYELQKQGEVYSVQVVHRGVIQAAANELYFEVDGSVHQLGVAFMPKPAFLKHDGLVSKMASSGAVKRGESYVQFAPFRVHSRVAPLAEGELLKNAPDQAGERLEIFTFYYYGQQLLMEVYADYAHLTGDGSEEWIGLQDAGTTLLGEAG
ncbi:hypothetical protein [Paenibacillus harenae]|uniref:DUF4362 domain-containing protein n=1 Tax=Paenibacillus harenae TaxID=306543 RepID=A0ABT9UCV8_PAEHA|nr:hypothetical protein [Paenibacillus harenae]MDQ0116279.1 hypothetical protein [Paenibacillus harenae]